ncbi:hypothetical protein NDU88_009221 [Pleurodeles waltl]|uniref:Uncharacterized protein n=1 Tax=Pleurodeles waltl TaxID=8319 RepID=A0AAV7RXR3_PLEWA|nr:hypothetical protein NDU88_009221 [Pleurodeles waltl]
MGTSNTFWLFTSECSSTHVPDSCIPPTGGTTPLHKLDPILQEIKDSCAAIEQRLGVTTIDNALIKDEHHKLTESVKMTKTTISVLEPAKDDQATQIITLKHQVKLLQERANFAEGRARRHYIRIIGQPEGMEGLTTKQYIEQGLRTSVAPEDLSEIFVVERAIEYPLKCQSRELLPDRWWPKS